VNAGSAITVTLPASPPSNAVVIVRNSDGTVITIDGNGKNINGNATVQTIAQGTAVVIHYFIDSDEWLIR